MAEVGSVVYFPMRHELTITGLRELFSDWRWLFWPRGKTKIPAEIITPLLELVGRSSCVASGS